MKGYIHRPLVHENDIRILHLQPARHFNDPLQCRLTEGNLNDKRSKYEALSYVWGSPTGNRPLICEGDQLLITPNCESALRHLRSKWKTRSLWVDSICIDQQSNSDRNHQVRLMGDVYAAARRVLVWLGESDKNTRPAFALLRILALLRKLPFDTSTRTWISHWKRAHEILENNKDGFLIELCSKPWFNRLWTIQEVALSRHSLAICGYESVSWPLLAFETLEQIEFSFLDVRQIPQEAIGLELRHSTWKSFHKDLHVDKAHSIDIIYTILPWVMKQTCADPKDRIFGLYTIFNKLGFGIPDPDYNKPLITLYEEFTVHYILYSQNLRVINLTRSFNRLSNLPTWVPDYSDPEILTAQLSIYHTYSPKTTVDPTTLHSRAPNLLPLRGKSVARIDEHNFRTESIDGSTGSVSNASVLRYFIPYLCDWYKLVVRQKLPRTGKNTAHLLVCLLTHGLFHQKIELLLPHVEELLRIMKQADSAAVQSCTKDSVHLELDQLVFNQLQEFVELVSETTQRLIEFIDSGRVMMCERKLFITSLGHFGRGPGSLQVGDLLVWFAGAHKPTIIRPVGENYELIGDAYVYELTEEDVFKASEDTSQLPIFTLQ